MLSSFPALCQGKARAKARRIEVEPIYMISYPMTWHKFAIFSLLASPLTIPFAGRAQSLRTAPRPLITQNINDEQLTTLHGNTRSEANAANDRGRVEDDFAMDHMLLQLRRSPEQEQALEQLIDSMHDRTSPNYQK